MMILTQNTEGTLVIFARQQIIARLAVKVKHRQLSLLLQMTNCFLLMENLTCLILPLPTKTLKDRFLREISVT